MPTCIRASVGVLYGEAGRGRPPACPHPGPFVPHLSTGVVSGSVTENLPPKGTRNWCPLGGDRAVVHPWYCLNLCVPGAPPLPPN